MSVDEPVGDVVGAAGFDFVGLGFDDPYAVNLDLDEAGVSSLAGD